MADVAADYSPSKSSLKRVRLDAANHDIDVLLVSSWTRLGRDLSEAIDTMAYLTEQNVAVQSAKERNMSLDQTLSFARFAAAVQIPDEAPSEEPDEALSENQKESESFDMIQSFWWENHGGHRQRDHTIWDPHKR